MQNSNIACRLNIKEESCSRKFLRNYFKRFKKQFLGLGYCMTLKEALEPQQLIKS